MSDRRADLRLELALLGLLALPWGASYPLLKVAVAEIPPLTLIGGRVTIAAAVLLLVLAQLAVLLGAALYAVAAIYGRRFDHLPAAVTAAGTMIWATIWLVPLALLVDRPWTLRPSVEALSAAAVLAVASTAGALLLYFRLVRTLGSMGVASQSYLRAAISVLLGMALLGERPTPLVLAGLAVIVLGVAAINLPARRAPAGR